jgi:hypothetical protein
MALDKFALYNNALLLIGQRELDSVTEDRPPRHCLDSAYDDPSAIDVCLELAKPRFAAKTTTLSSPAVSPDHALDSVHTLPTDYVTIVGVYSDDKLDQPIRRYLIEDESLVCEYGTIYLRYISNTRAMTSWSPMFAQLVSTYLAHQLCIKFSPAIFDAVHALYLDTIKLVQSTEGEKEPAVRSTAPTVTLTNAWRKIYNDALFILGLDEITSNLDDSNRRTKLDRTLDANVVESLLEETGWQFALQSQKVTYDPSANPSWGHKYAFQKPSDIHRLDGIWTDEQMQNPLKLYADEGGYWMTGCDTIYVQYVSTDFLHNPDGWPTFFRRLVAAAMARDVAQSLVSEGANVENAIKTFTDRESSAKGNDAVQSPPRVLSRGKWVSARTRGGSFRNRPGDF